MSNKNITSEKLILGLGTFAPLFLFLLHLNHTIFHCHFVLIGVVQEMLTIPCILGQPLLLFFAIRGLCLNKFNEKIYAQIAVGILIVGIGLTVTKFIVSQSA